MLYLRDTSLNHSEILHTNALINALSRGVLGFCVQRSQYAKKALVQSLLKRPRTNRSLKNELVNILQEFKEEEWR